MPLSDTLAMRIPLRKSSAMQSSELHDDSGSSFLSSSSSSCHGITLVWAGGTWRPRYHTSRIWPAVATSKMTTPFPIAALPGLHCAGIMQMKNKRFTCSCSCARTLASCSRASLACHVHTGSSMCKDKELHASLHTESISSCLCVCRGRKVAGGYVSTLETKHGQLCSDIPCRQYLFTCW